MKFMIAGLGSIGRRHLHNLQALGQNDILLYRTGKSSLPETDLAGLPTETDLQSALDKHPQAVIISNPTALHMSVAIPAAEAGCNILLEKPLSHSMEGVDQLELALQRGGGRLLVGYHFRFHPTLRTAASLIQSGKLGDLVSVHARWGEFLPDWHPWEDFRLGYSARPDLGGGAILTLSHPLDYLRFLVGEISELWAFSSTKGLNLQVEDTAEIGLRFFNGVIGSLHLDYLQRPPEHHLQITGTKGSLRWENRDGSLDLYHYETQTWEKFTPPTGFERNTMFLDEMNHFIKLVQGGSESYCTLQDGKQALRLALAALRSAREGMKIKLEIE